MSEVSLEDLATQVDKLTEQLGETTLIDWKNVQNSQLEMSKSFDALNRSLMMLRNAMQQNYVKTLRELKAYDVKDLVKIVKDGKQTSDCLVQVVSHVKKDTEGNITLNQESIQSAAKSVEDKFSNTNNGVASFLFESVQKIEKLSKDIIQTPKVNEEEKKQSEETSKNELANIQAVKELESKEYNFDQSKLSEIASQISLQYIPDTNNKLISIQTYSQIVEKSVELAQQEYQRLTNENREERRKLKDETKKYVKIMIDHMNDIENMLMKSQEEICKKIGISQENLEKSEMLLMERGLGQHIFMMQAGVRQKIKDKMPKNKDISVKETKELIKFQIQLLNEKQQLFKPALQEIMNNYDAGQLIPIILNLIMNDLVYEAKQIEEEDYMYNLADTNIFKDQEVIELLKQIEQAIFALLNDCGFLQKQQQAMQGMQAMQQQGGMGGQMGGMGGFPGGGGGGMGGFPGGGMGGGMF